MFHFLKNARDWEVHLSCYENSRVQGKFQSMDANQDQIVLCSLQTPIGKYPNAIVRASDVVAMDFTPSTTPALP
ncbi:hypothetical protein GUITHDRAFT_154985 [Guillardia theta CCMP2712]|uniref:LSM domain-containing protein n=2 Tax=Guillardia theta TaxID=55529 RepID=L1IM93_GUITC|nr:hypothetical protein GUITHDRAFT_154985 [Guillardia theta CCMP2712]EKX37361.1 hypothetical protein GUITHDRAFT_154985 [Guillardia theta CCMP2712]|eukprot:XP_005824341.1 hypothetical protein GUITHDRAFT_154985 [Guillardia theta CCMP2712]